MTFSLLPTNDFTTTRAYNDYLTSPVFWDSIVCERVLMFQLDSLVLRPGITSALLDYDFIGEVLSLLDPSSPRLQSYGIALHCSSPLVHFHADSRVGCRGTVGMVRSGVVQRRGQRWVFPADTG